MIIGKIEGATRSLAAPENWNEETDGRCGDLAIRDSIVSGLPTMISAWEPTPAELALLNQGAKIYLAVVGRGHPPVMLYVGEPPEEDKACPICGRIEQHITPTHDWNCDR